MKTIEDINSDILQEWKASDPERFTDANFTSDGLVCDNDVWENAPLRILYITKDQNASKSSWNLCEERDENLITLSSLKYSFFRNMLYTLYGLRHTNAFDGFVDYDDYTKQDSLDNYWDSALARINVKKQAGTNSVTNSQLIEFINKDVEFIKRQILNLDADIIVCCGHSQSIPNTGNIILNFVIQNCYPGLTKSVNDNWIYFDESRNKLAINSWHMSYRIGSKRFYDDMIGAYYNFLQQHPNFTNSHRR